MTDNSQITRELDSWLATVNANYLTEDRAFNSIETLEKLAALKAASGDIMETPANMQVTGTQDVARQQARLYETQLKTGAHSEESIDAMLRAPATGLMHISDMARISSNWNPTILSNNAANSAAYDDYLRKIIKFPLVTLNYAESQEITRNSSDWNTVIDEIADTFVGIQGEDKDAIVKGLKNLAQAASSTMSTEEKTSLFCQNAINTSDRVYELFLYNSTCAFVEKKGKGFHTYQSTFTVLKIKLTLKIEFWTREYVAKLIGQTSDSLDTWLQNNSTSTEGTKPIVGLS